jgi:tetratricopeptide (TPR) repeat protein
MKSRSVLFLLLFVTLASSVLAQSRRDEGIELYRASKFQAAVDVLQEVVKEDEKDRTAMMYLGASLYHTGRTEEAVEAFKKCKWTIKDLPESFDIRVEIANKPRPDYTNEARQNNVQGTVKLAVEFLSDGTIGFIVPVDRLAGGLTENTLTAATNVKFKPAQKNGKPVTVVGILAYSFSIY